MMAFGAISAALYGRVTSGEGQFIDISMVETIFNMHPFAIQGPSLTDGKTRLRRTGRHFGSVPPAGTYKGPQGWLALHVLEGQWARPCEAATAIDLASMERYQTPAGRAEHRNELVEMLKAWDADLPERRGVDRTPRGPSGSGCSGHRSGRRPPRDRGTSSGA